MEMFALAQSLNLALLQILSLLEILQIGNTLMLAMYNLGLNSTKWRAHLPQR